MELGQGPYCDSMNIKHKIDIAWAGAVASAIVWMFATFATASEVEELKLELLYGIFWDRLDDYEEESAEGDTQSAERLKREIQRLLASICEHDPEFDYCDESF